MVCAPLRLVRTGHNSVNASSSDAQSSTLPFTKHNQSIDMLILYRYQFVSTSSRPEELYSSGSIEYFAARTRASPQIAFTLH